MNYRDLSFSLSLLILGGALPGCVVKIDDGSTDTASASGTSGDPSTSTTGGTDGTGGTGGTGTGSASATGTSDPTTGAGSTTGVDPGAFERFRMNFAAGPCPMEEDCDGFVELLSDKTLRVEKFGDATDTVIEVPISQADFDAAVLVFADPALAALLDGPSPVCNPPTDIFESMEVVLAGVTHQNSTTLCDQAPVVAARDTADMLELQYVP